ncbi:MAG: hypothetical protein PHN88_15555 [Ignavibacteria bacterium]|nr:hypothetical protein [Ignavibacteria bacterium]
MIDTHKVSRLFRKRAINTKSKTLLISRLTGSDQERDLTIPTNCGGFGRIRHFKLHHGLGWPNDPLPIIPAAKALNINHESEMRAQVFQNSVCNWRCWYCYVDYSLLKGDTNKGQFLSCGDLVSFYLKEKDPPLVIDISGGQPDLTPEWIPWMMEELIKNNLQDKIFLWSDDNLSNDYFWKYLSDDQLTLIKNYKMYARVCCFKGINEESFSLNTNAHPKDFENQFELFQKLINTSIDLYCYLTITAKTDTLFDLVIPKFLDRLQKIHPLLPLKVVPLKIIAFTPMKNRLGRIYEDMIAGQFVAIKIWIKELEKRFSDKQRHLPITEIKIN